MCDEYIRQCTVQALGIPKNLSPSHLEVILKEQVEIYSVGNVVSATITPDFENLENVIRENKIVAEKLRNN